MPSQIGLSCDSILSGCHSKSKVSVITAEQIFGFPVLSANGATLVMSRPGLCYESDCEEENSASECVSTGISIEGKICG